MCIRDSQQTVPLANCHAHMLTYWSRYYSVHSSHLHTMRNNSFVLQLMVYSQRHMEANLSVAILVAIRDSARVTLFTLRQDRLPQYLRLFFSFVHTHVVMVSRKVCYHPRKLVFGQTYGQARHTPSQIPQTAAASAKS